MMDVARLAKMKHRATQAIESARGDGFAEFALELIAHLEGLNQHIEQSAEPEPMPEPVSDPELEITSELDPTTPKRKRKVAEAGGDLSGSD